jgi:hypothetical protein
MPPNQVTALNSTQKYFHTLDLHSHSYSGHRPLDKIWAIVDRWPGYCMNFSAKGYLNQINLSDQGAGVKTNLSEKVI